MNFPKYIPGPVEYWFSAAGTEFLNGCLEGLGGGAIVGGGSGATTALTSIGEKMPPASQVVLALCAFVATLAASGVKRFVIWHHNGNPFPNPYPKPPAP